MTEDSPEEKPTHAARVGRKAPRHKLSQGRDDALDWLAYETANVSREAQLRIQDATEFTTEYARGRISSSEFDKRQSNYWSKWGEALRGVAASRGMTDEEIFNEIEAIRNRSRGLRER